MQELTDATVFSTNLGVAASLIVTIIGATAVVCRSQGGVLAELREIKQSMRRGMVLSHLAWRNWALLLKAQNPTLDVPAVPDLLLDNEDGGER